MKSKTINPLSLEAAISEIKQLLGENIPEKSLFSHYLPKEEWFLKHDTVAGIHGITHMLRVLVLQELLSALLIKDGVYLDQEALRWAAVTHDLRRANELIDLSHPKQASLWVEENLRDIIPLTSIDKVIYLNRWHSSANGRVPDITAELTVLKDTDALDRVRLGDQYFDPAHLYYDISKKLLVQPAKALFQGTCKKQELGVSPFPAVMDAAVELGLIANR